MSLGVRIAGMWLLLIFYLVGVIGCAWEVAFLIEPHLCPGGGNRI